MKFVIGDCILEFEKAAEAVMVKCFSVFVILVWVADLPETFGVTAANDDESSDSRQLVNSLMVSRFAGFPSILS